MALRTSSMKIPYSDPSVEPDQERYHLPRKLVILLLLVVASSLWLYILFHERKLGLGTTVQEIAAGVIVAIVAGLGAQLILSRRDGYIRFVAAMAADVAGIYLLGFISNGRYGISKFGWLPRSMDYDGLNLIAIGFVIILFISLLFRRPTVIVISDPVLTPLGEPENSTVLVEPSNSISIADPVQPRVSFPRISISGFFTPGTADRSNGHRAGTGRIRPARPASAITPKRRRRRAKARVQLALVQEHRCPYCLDTVTRSDARGVVQCNICHTLHHKDCWDITGACQVPHLYN